MSRGMSLLTYLFPIYITSKPRGKPTKQMLVGKPIEVHLAPVGQPPKKHVRAQYLLPEPES